MKKRWHMVALMAVAAACAQSAQAGGYVALSGSGRNVLTTCNPSGSTSDDRCEVTSLPGEAGYTETASRSSDLVINDVTVGRLYEKIWRNGADPKLYVFGTKIVLNDAIWDDSGQPFRVNDIFRRALPVRGVAVAYFRDGAVGALQFAGRTVQGAGEYRGAQPRRENSFVEGRVAADGGAAGSAAAQTPWLLVKTRAVQGIALDPFGIRVLNSSTADPTELFTAGYQPNGLPEPGDDDDD